MLYFKTVSSIEEIYDLLAFLVSGIWSLLLSFFCQFLFQAAFTIAMHSRFAPVLTKVFGYVIFVGIILRHYHNLVKGLQ